MSNTLYDYGRELFLSGQLNWNTATIKCCLVDTTSGAYAYSAAHKFFLSVSGNAANVIAQPVPLTWSAGGGLPVAGGAADADDVKFSNVVGTSIEAIIIFQDKGTGDGGAPLIAYIDTATGLPITPNGGDIIVTWDNGVNKIFRL
jgi:hypothetical protein